MAVSEFWKAAPYKAECSVGGDVESGLAIAEMLSSLSKPTVSLVLGGSHSIGVPLAVCPISLISSFSFWFFCCVVVSSIFSIPFSSLRHKVFY